MWAGWHVVRWAFRLNRSLQCTMNHSEQLMFEWLQYRSEFVSRPVQVGPRPSDSFKSKFDVVGMHLDRHHLINAEWSVTTLSTVKL